MQDMKKRLYPVFATLADSSASKIGALLRSAIGPRAQAGPIGWPHGASRATDGGAERGP